jgi:hypothetical protein
LGVIELPLSSLESDSGSNRLMRQINGLRKTDGGISV